MEEDPLLLDRKCFFILKAIFFLSEYYFFPFSFLLSLIDARPLPILLSGMVLLWSDNNHSNNNNNQECLVVVTTTIFPPLREEVLSVQ
jgi:hypothetical protein